ncbi:DUF4384 domain-containing protein [Endothiovibrio diazotrophicus]
MLKNTPPREKVTNYSAALTKLGLMTEIYPVNPIYIQSTPIDDKTGTSGVTVGEIPKDITEMTKSALNSIGGKVTYIPYDQDYLSSKYGLSTKIRLPDIVISGGITEFDRALETIGSSRDVGVDSTLNGEAIGIEAGKQGKQGTARITLDFNMLDYHYMTGIPRVNVRNTMEVHKARSENGFNISLFGLSFGSKGEIKKVQGRHDAVRLLVELSVIQMIGKYVGIPYWRILDENAAPDPYVVDRWKATYSQSSDQQRIDDIQTWLYLYGFDVPRTDILDPPTINALTTLKGPNALHGKSIDFQLYSDILFNIPITEQAKHRRRNLKEQPTHSSAISLEMVLNQKTFKEGDHLIVTTRISKDGHLDCYYQDGQGTVFRIYPNPLQNTTVTAGGVVTKIPDSRIHNGNFTIEVGSSRNNEFVACVAGTDPLDNYSATAHSVPPLTPIKVTNLQALLDEFNDGKSAGKITYQIERIPIN